MKFGSEINSNNLCENGMLLLFIIYPVRFLDNLCLIFEFVYQTRGSLFSSFFSQIKAYIIQFGANRLYQQPFKRAANSSL